MVECKWVDYSGAAPILLPVSVSRHWLGYYLPAEPDDDAADLELPEGRFVFCDDDCDFADGKTDYDRACALGGIPAAQTLSVGPGQGLVLATEMDLLTWHSESLMVVNGGRLPDPTLVERVVWSDECVWMASEPEFILMNACDHGANPDKDDHFAVRLEPGKYIVQWGQYGWADDDPALILFRFVKQEDAEQSDPKDGGSDRRV